MIFPLCVIVLSFESTNAFWNVIIPTEYALNRKGFRNHLSDNPPLPCFGCRSRTACSRVQSARYNIFINGAEVYVSIIASVLRKSIYEPTFSDFSILLQHWITNFSIYYCMKKDDFSIIWFNSLSRGYSLRVLYPCTLELLPIG